MTYDEHFEYLAAWIQGPSWFRGHPLDQRRFQRAICALHSAGLLPESAGECEAMLHAAIAHFGEEIDDQQQEQRIKELANIAAGAGPFLDLCGEFAAELEQATAS